PLATLYVFSQAIGTFQVGKEYWYVNRNAVSTIGSADLSITITDHDNSETPQDPGYGSEQKFALAENVSWGSGWTTDPVSGGSLYTGADPNGNPQGLRLFTAGVSGRITRIVWYQALTSGSPANITPGGTFSVGSGAFGVPSGETGYDISQTTGG